MEEAVQQEEQEHKPKNHKDHTTGSIIGSILKMGLPSMIGFGIGNIYDLIDMYWLSQLGSDPVAAITMLGPFLWVIHSANHVVGVGSVAIISRRYGEKEYVRTERAIKETLLLKWVAAICFGAIGYFIVPFMMHLMGADGQLVEIGVTYGRIIFIGLGFNFATYSIFTALRGTANPAKAMILMISISCLNMALDPFMIFGLWIFPKMGVAGAAWASVISYAVAFFVGLYMFYSGKANVKLHLNKNNELKWETMWRMLKIGIPSAIGQISFSLARLVIMPMISVFGMGVVAAYGVSQRVSALGIMLLVGIGLGLSALIGHNMGANKYERARKTANQAIWLSIGMMCGVGALTALFAPQIMRLFFDAPDLIAYGVTMLRIMALAMPFLALHLIIESVYGGVGENRPVMVFSIIHAWVLEIPAVYITTQLLGFDQNAVWWSINGAITITGIGYYFYFKRGGWLKVQV